MGNTKGNILWTTVSFNITIVRSRKTEVDQFEQQHWMQQIHKNKLIKTKSILYGHNSKEMYLQKIKITNQRGSLPTSFPETIQF